MTRPIPPDEMSGLPTVSIDAHIAIISLNRPKQHNRLGVEDIERLHQLLGQIDEDADVRAVVLTARGKSFCSGYDIAALSRSSQHTESSPSGADFGRICDALEATRQPTVCALNGPLYGGAIDLALACDFRVGHKDLHMFIPAAQLGLHYYGSGMVRYVSRLGLAASKRLFLLGEKLSCEEMRQHNFLDLIVPQEEVITKSIDLASRLADNAPIAVQGMKKSLNEIAAHLGDIDAIDDRFRRSTTSEELAKGLAAFAEQKTRRLESNK